MLDATDISDTILLQEIFEIDEQYEQVRDELRQRQEAMIRLAERRNRLIAGLSSSGRQAVFLAENLRVEAT